MPPTHCVYNSAALSRQAGGPSGYLWHLEHGLLQTHSNSNIEFVIPSPGSPPWQPAQRLDSALRRWPALWRLMRTYAPNPTSKRLKRSTRQPREYSIAPDILDKLVNFRSIHCHSTHDLLSVHNSLQSAGARTNVKLMLSSHTPEMPALEIVESLKAAGLIEGLADRALPYLRAVDEAAFTLADHIVFPSAEATEPYVETFPNFNRILDSKAVSYLLTGIADIGSAEPSPILDDVNGLKFSYVGRHNSTKGYDLLLEVMPAYLAEHGGCLLVAGKIGPLTPPLLPQWREVGWTSNPHSLIAATDIFILPNRRTYFDIVALEVMALGIPLLASTTGGNLTLAKLSAGVITFTPTAKGLREALAKISATSPEELRAKGRANREAYERYFSSLSFARSYCDIVSSVQNNESHK